MGQETLPESVEQSFYNHGTGHLSQPITGKGSGTPEDPSENPTMTTTKPQVTIIHCRDNNLMIRICCECGCIMGTTVQLRPWRSSKKK